MAGRYRRFNEHAVIFLHIPKAAGTTLHRVLERQFPRETIFSIDGANVQKSINEFKNLSEKERLKIKCLKGHMPFGLHEYFPQPSTYVTLLRDPIDRIISHYYFVLRRPDHYLHAEVTSKRMSLRDYVDSGISPELMNGQTRLISGFEGNTPLSRDVLEVAQSNLKEYFAVVGTFEKFDETLVLMKMIFGWRNVLYAKQNVTKKRPLKEDVPSNALRIIEKYNILDLELYEFSKKIMEEMIDQQGPSFQTELRNFKVWNRYLGFPYGMTCQVVQKGYSLLRSVIQQSKWQQVL